MLVVGFEKVNKKQNRRDWERALPGLPNMTEYAKSRAFSLSLSLYVSAVS